jgi:HSP20 family protein
MSRRRKTIFDVFDELFREIQEEFEEFVREAERVREEGFLEPKEGFEIKGPYVYGFRLTIGPDGKPRIEEFGNVRRVGRRPRISEEIEPLVDVIDEGNKIRVVAEIPGVEKEKINLKAVNNKLIIKATNFNRKYYKEIELPAEVKIETAKASYRNGVLEVVMDKKEKKPEEGGVEIKIE